MDSTLTKNGPWIVFLGPFFHAQSKEEPLVIQGSDSLIGLQDGEIRFIGEKDQLENLITEYGFSPRDVRILEKGFYLMPGMVDTHLHAPQFPNLGLGADLPLIQWLHTYTYPLESKFGNFDFAKSAYEPLVKATLRNGTTTANYFTTIHSRATEVLAEICQKFGQRAIIGHCSKNSPTPDYYRESTDDCLKNSQKLIQHIQSLNCPRIYPSICPRSGLSCNEDLLSKLGNLAIETGTRIHTHLSESMDEIETVKKKFPNFETYSNLYESTKILGPNTILAHCNYLSDVELETLKRNRVAISHCPISNITLHSGLCPVRKYLDAGVRVGLGSDISGGYSLSMLENMKVAVMTSKILHIQNPKNTQSSPLTYEEAFYLGTLGGAEALSLEEQIGNFVVGKKFDGLLVKLTGGLDLPIEETVQNFFRFGDDRNIVEVWVEGKLSNMEEQCWTKRA